MKRCAILRRTPLKRCGFKRKPAQPGADWRARTEVALPKRTRLRARSPKRAADDRKYEKEKAAHFLMNPQCQHPDGCTRSLINGDQMDLHHRAGRNGPLLYGESAGYLSSLASLTPEHLAQSQFAHYQAATRMREAKEALARWVDSQPTQDDEALAEKVLAWVASVELTEWPNHEPTFAERQAAQKNDFMRNLKATFAPGSALPRQAPSGRSRRSLTDYENTLQFHSKTFLRNRGRVTRRRPNSESDSLPPSSVQKNSFSINDCYRNSNLPHIRHQIRQLVDKSTPFAIQRCIAQNRRT